MIRAFSDNLHKRISLMRDRLSESPIIYRLARGAFWSLVGSMAVRAISMFSSIIIARLLGKEGYGEVGIVQSTMWMFGVFAGLGLGSAGTKYIAEFRLSAPERAGKILNLIIVLSIGSGLLITVLCLFLTPWLAENTLNRPDLEPLLMAGALLMFVTTISGVQAAALSGFEAFREIARINILQGIMTPFIAIPCVWFLGVNGAIASITINTAIGSVLSAIALKQECIEMNIPCRIQNSFWQESHILWKFAMPAMFSGLMVTPVTWATNVILVSQPGGYGEMGIFNAANQWRMVLLFIPNIMSSAVLPVLAETHSRKDKSIFVNTTALNLKATWSVALPLTVMLVTLTEPLAALFGKQFAGSEKIMSYLMLGCFLNLINGAVGSALAGAGKIWSGLLMNFLWALILVVASIFLVPKLGGRGLALSYLIAYMFHTIWQMLYLELHLARSSITNQWPLIILTIFLFTASLMLNSTDMIAYGLKLSLIIISSIPLLLLMKQGFAKLLSDER